MALAESLFARLRSLGTAAGESIFPSIAPAGQGAPYIVWQEISAQPDLTLGEPSNSARHVVQFSCVADTYQAARDLGAQVVAALDNQTLPGGEVCLGCTELDGFSEATDQFLRIVEADFFSSVQPAV